MKTSPPVRRRLAQAALTALLCLLAALAAGCPENAPEAEGERPDIDPPAAPYYFSAEAGAAGVTLTWQSPAVEHEADDDDVTVDQGESADEHINKDLAGYLIVRAEGDYPDAFPERGVQYQVGSALGAGAVIAVLAKKTEQLVDPDVQTGRTYFYEAMTFDEVPNYSESARVAATPGSLVWARLAHAQTALADGRVLLTGGLGAAGPLDVAEIYDPATSAFRPVLAEMTVARFGHTATLLADGRVLLAGGYESGFIGTLNSAELFDPETETFARVDSAMDLGRALHTATALSDGRVLLIGGTDGVNALDTLELFDPETGQFALQAQKLPTARYGHQAGLLEDRTVVFGGFDGFETVDAACAVWADGELVTSLEGAANAETPMPFGALNATLSPLADGRWLLAGGFVGTLKAGAETADALLFLPDDAPYFAAVEPMAQARSGHQAAALSDGRVLLCGGIAPGQIILDSAELYDPVAGEFGPAALMHSPRTGHQMALLSDGRALVTGGNRSVDLFAPDPCSTAEVYDPATAVFSVVGATP
jgi:hypothetical protein